MRKKIITKTSDQYKKDELQSIKDRTCPNCGYNGALNSICIDSRRWEGNFLFGEYVRYTEYTCHKCHTEWEIRED